MIDDGRVAGKYRMPAFPEPMFALAMEPASRGDEQKIGGALDRLREEDPCFRTTRDMQTKELVAQGRMIPTSSLSFVGADQYITAAGPASGVSSISAAARARGMDASVFFGIKGVTILQRGQADKVELPQPFGSCGDDPPGDDLVCISYPGCAGQ